MRYFAIFFAAVIVGCGRPSAVPDPSPSFTHAWVMSGPMGGYMGVSIALTTNEYFYWFYSDVASASAPTYPLRGAYTFDDSSLRLQATEELYSREWNIVTNRGYQCLRSASDSGTDRLLIPHPSFDPTRPFCWNSKEKKQNKAIDSIGE